ncbi:hypothetical protein GBF38_000698 [Nibea albiflora]|nr:hypothetical protein GBF38_000698 [Nibea albiflora]
MNSSCMMGMECSITGSSFDISPPSQAKNLGPFSSTYTRTNTTSRSSHFLSSYKDTLTTSCLLTGHNKVQETETTSARFWLHITIHQSHLLTEPPEPQSAHRDTLVSVPVYSHRINECQLKFNKVI